MSTVTVFPYKVMGKLTRYPFGIRMWSSKAFREFDSGVRVGESKVIQHEADMTQIEAPLSMTILCTPLPFEVICTWNASW